MSRSTKESWLNGQGDIREAEVFDVPVPGESVLVRGLSAKWSAEVMSQLKLVQEGQSQSTRIDVGRMEMLQFVHGVVEPSFTEEEARQVQERFGPAFRKVVEKVQELSGIDQEAVEETKHRFPDGGAGEDGPPGGNGAGAGVRGSDVPARAGA